MRATIPAIVLELACLAATFRTPTRCTVKMVEGAAAHSGATVLLGPIQAECCEAWLESHPDLPHPRMVITTHEKKPPMTNEAIDAFTQFCGEAVALQVPFSVLWDARGPAGCFPSLAHFRTVIRWLESEAPGAGGRIWAEEYDERVLAHAIVLSNPALRGAVGVMARVASPPQPVRTFGAMDVDKALDFAREQGVAH